MSVSVDESFFVIEQTNFTSCTAAPNNNGFWGVIYHNVTSQNSKTFKFNERINFGTAVVKGATIII
jgi:hypothetical protein